MPKTARHIAAIWNVFVDATGVNRPKDDEMPENIMLHSYRFSVYSRIAKVALLEKRLCYKSIEIDPFAADVAPDYRENTPLDACQRCSKAISRFTKLAPLHAISTLHLTDRSLPHLIPKPLPGWLK
jgi:hypothetical protein